MSQLLKINKKDFPIPGRLNLAIGITSIAISIFLLYWTNLQNTWYLILAGAVLFSFVNNTTFSLMHEASHGHFHKSRSLNLWGGRVLAAFFPTSFTMQQLYHLGHHRRNRTDAEMFDLYYPKDNLFLKKFIIFGTVFGIYWTTPFISCILFFINPNWILSPSVKDSKFMKSISADAMLGGLEKALIKVPAVRFEILLTVAIQASLFYFLNLSWWTWLACYWAFGINWGSLQYADHVGSARDIREGAWNLKVNPVVRYIFLNYHLHKVHHRYPTLPWIHLPKLVDKNEPFPTYTSKLWEFLTGPRPALEPSPVLQKDLAQEIFKGTPLEKANSL